VKVAVFGESFGTGVAVALARERPVAGVLLNAPYASVLRLFELSGPPLPYRWLLIDQFDSEALIGDIGVPVMILHGTADSNIPITEARRLYAAARQPKTMIEVEGAGHLAAWEGGASEPALEKPWPTGEADLYPRFGTTMEWDTAAGQAVSKPRAAGLGG
jgi:fermentation-respiration switch protein FrsA (DUF1100 family)